MFHHHQSFVQPVLPALVLDEYSFDDVAKKIIEKGSQLEPFYLFDMDEAYRHIQRFRNKMPRIQIFYAMKANDSEMMVKLAIAMGCGFDCASVGEISRIRNFNVHPESIIYACPTKTPEQMMYARQSGVKHTTFNTSCELHKFKQYWPDAKLLIRIKVDSNSIYKLGEKFGCDFETEATGLLKEAARLGLSVVGVAFHVGSACFSNDSYAVGFRQARALFDHEAKAGRQMKILDIGGGFFGDQTERFNEVSQLINEQLTQLFPDPNVQVIAEPGRFLCETSFRLYVNINNVKRFIENEKVINMLYLNDGVHGTLRFIEEWHTVHKLHSSSGEPLEETILWGPTPDAKDRMVVPSSSTFQLPRCTTQDWLVFTLQGAYTHTFRRKFAGFETALIQPIVSSRTWKEIKNSAVYTPSDFIVNPTFEETLPSTLPPLLPSIGINEHTHLTALC